MTALFPAATGATFSPCGLYRYDLWRTWDDRKPIVGFIGLNPSTADAETNDNTIRKEIAFAKSLGYGGLVKANLFAFRSTDPRSLLTAADPIGPGNDAAIMALFERCRDIIAAWGTKGIFRSRDIRVCELIIAAGHRPRMHYLKMTKYGHPQHPLYLPGNTQMTPFDSPHFDAGGVS